VTFEVAGGQRYRVQLIEPDDIALARSLFAGNGGPSIPNGRVLHGTTGINEGYSWSIDPRDLEFADVTTEVCDGTPGDVGLASWSSDRYCPWTAQIVAIVG
jgi:hypothetical protein